MRNHANGERSAQPLDDRRQIGQDHVHLVGGRPAPQREGQRAPCLPLAETHRPKRRRRLAGEHPARGPGRGGDPRQVERQYEALAFDSRHDEAGVLRQPVATRSDEPQRGASWAQAVDQPVAQHLQAPRLGRALAEGELRCHAQPDGAGEVCGARAQPFFLAGAQDLRREAQPRSNPQGSDSRRSAKIVRTDREEIDAIGLDRDRQPSEAHRLRPDGEARRPRGSRRRSPATAARSPPRRWRRRGPRDRCRAARRGGRRPRRDPALTIDRDRGDLEPRLDEVPARREKRRVLDRARHDVASRPSKGHALDGEVVGLGRSAQEHDAVGPAADQATHLRARRAERLARLLPETVAGRRVAHPALEERAHHSEDPGVNRGEVGVVEVGATSRADAAPEPIGSSGPGNGRRRRSGQPQGAHSPSAGPSDCTSASLAGSSEQHLDGLSHRHDPKGLPCPDNRNVAGDASGSPASGPRTVAAPNPGCTRYCQRYCRFARHVKAGSRYSQPRYKYLDSPPAPVEPC